MASLSRDMKEVRERGVWRQRGRESQAEVLKDCGFFAHLHVLSLTPAACSLGEASCQALSCPRAMPGSKNPRQLQLTVCGELRPSVQQPTRKLVLPTAMADGSGLCPSRAFI